MGLSSLKSPGKASWTSFSVPEVENHPVASDCKVAGANQVEESDQEQYQGFMESVRTVCRTRLSGY